MKWLAIIVSVVVVGAIVAGFLAVGSPAHQRLVNFDERKTSDLSNIQYQIISYWQQKNKLPASFTDLHDSINGYVAPTDPQTNVAYEYRVTGDLNFQLCANFNLKSSASQTPQYSTPFPSAAYNPYTDNWSHEAGRVCFDRLIDPQLYKPVPAPK